MHVALKILLCPFNLMIYRPSMIPLKGIQVHSWMEIIGY